MVVVDSTSGSHQRPRWNQHVDSVDKGTTIERASRNACIDKGRGHRGGILGM